MKVEIIRDRLLEYKAQSLQEEQNALAEIAQEILLSALSRSDFFKNSAFQGGTCLRILYHIPRFSEDLDFVLINPNSNFSWDKYHKAISLEFESYGIELTINDRSKENETIKKTFIKADSIGKILTAKFEPIDRKIKSIKIKLEIDTNPPYGSSVEIKHLDFPFPFPITTQDIPSLFAGKCHALLCREYIKGRDWYDLVWYIGRRSQVNYVFLSSAMKQNGQWEGQDLEISKMWIINELKKKTKKIDWEAAKSDLARFLTPSDFKLVGGWNKDFFMDRIEVLNEYLI